MAVAKRDTKTQILIVGDMVNHALLQPATKGEDYRGNTEKTGAVTLKAMIAEALSRTGKKVGKDGLNEMKKIISVHNEDVPPSELAELITVFKFFPPKSPANERDDKVLRVKAEYYTPANPSKRPKPPASNGEFFSKSSSEEKNILVVYDRSSSLRKSIKADGLGGNLSDLASNALGGVVIAIRDNLHECDEKSNSWLGIMKEKLAVDDKGRERTLTMVNADALRKCGLAITEYGSIEQSVRDVVKYRGHKYIKALLAMGDHLVVVFRETGALYLNATTNEGSIHFCPNFDRVAQEDTERFGLVPGKFTIILTSVVREIYARDGNSSGWDIAGALRLGVAAYNFHFKSGFEKDQKLGITANPLTALEKSCSLKRREEIMKVTTDTKEPSQFLLTSLNFNNWPKGLESWSRTDGLLSSFQPKDKKKEEEKLLFDIVRNGLLKAFRVPDADVKKFCDVSKPSDPTWIPMAVITCPFARFGKIKSVDPAEIATFNSLGRLIGKYLRSDQWSSPLSIAVFGRPGAGKSFAVKQILKTVSPGRKNEPLIFNLAQFDSVDQLTEAFHQVQDRALSEDEVPLVIFDEFDCHFGAPLGWLKYFLAPMQDGLFRGKAADYRVGRAIFLFSGGTSDNFKAFNEQRLNFDDQRALKTQRTTRKPSKEELVLRRRAKLDDFISRLRGYLDVSDINGSLDFPLKLRRAVILRSMLEEHAKPILRPDEAGREDIANIEEPVITAFLDAKKYEHGVRSMEAIIQMSRWIGSQFVAASLPSKDQLKSHVDLASFDKILNAV